MEAMRAGIGRLHEDRPTDHDEALARRRYQAFKEQTWDALQSLKEIFHYHFINARGSIREVEQNILVELDYQSTLELDPRTVDRLRGIPVASAITVHARQEMVKRLEVPFEVLSDERFALTNALRLPTFTVEGMRLLKRLTLVVRNHRIEHVFYPVFPPDKHAEEVIAWLEKHPITA